MLATSTVNDSPATSKLTLCPNSSAARPLGIRSKWSTRGLAHVRACPPGPCASIDCRPSSRQPKSGSAPVPGNPRAAASPCSLIDSLGRELIAVMRARTIGYMSGCPNPCDCRNSCKDWRSSGRAVLIRKIVGHVEARKAAPPIGEQIASHHRQQQQHHQPQAKGDDLHDAAPRRAAQAHWQRGRSAMRLPRRRAAPAREPQPGRSPPASTPDRPPTLRQQGPRAPSSVSRTKLQRRIANKAASASR